MCICMPANLHKITIYMSKRYKHAQCWCKWKTLVSRYFLKTLLHYACCKWSLVAFTKSWLATPLAWSRGYIYTAQFSTASDLQLCRLQYHGEQRCRSAYIKACPANRWDGDNPTSLQRTQNWGSITAYLQYNPSQDFLDVYYWYY